MEIFNWIFRRKSALDQAPAPRGEVVWDFRKSEHPSERKWRWHLQDIAGQQVALGIAGIYYRFTEVTNFVRAAGRKERVLDD